MKDTRLILGHWINDGRHTREDLNRFLHYHPETGTFTWKTNGKRAGTIGVYGYCKITLNGKGYRRSRLVWFFETGEWPQGELDHKDRVRDNDRFENLRIVTRSQNIMNSKIRSDNKTGVRGVKLDKKSGKFVACFREEYLGIFDTIEAAKSAYDLKAKT